MQKLYIYFTFAQIISMKKNFWHLFKNRIMFVFIILITTILLSGCGQQTSKVYVDGIEISKKNLYLAEGQTAVISAQVYPFNADNQEYSFESSDESIVTIEDGFVTAKKAGDAVIYVYSLEGGYKDSCNVLVTTAGNNLELNSYNNLNMPPKELEPIYYENTSSKNNRYKTNRVSQNNQEFQPSNIQKPNKKTFKQQLRAGIQKVNAEINDDIMAGKNVLEEIKNDLMNSINNIEQQKQDIISMYDNLFKDTQNGFMESVKNFQTKIYDDIKQTQNSMIQNIENAKVKIDDGEYTVESGDINGVTFVVIKNTGHSTQSDNLV